MESGPDYMCHTHRLSRRTFVAGALVAGGLLAISIRQAAALAPGDSVVTTSDVNLRSGPGLRFDVIEILPAGTSGVIDGIPDPNDADGYTWYGFMSPDNTHGYVAGEYLASGNSAPSFPIGSKIIVTTDALNVRSQPDLGSVIRDVIYYGTVGFIESASVPNNGSWWIDVSFPQVDGWVVTDYIQAYSNIDGKFAIGDTVYVIDGPLNLRASPGLKGTILDTLVTGDAGQVVADPQGADGYVWYQVQLSPSESGWVVQDFLSSSPPSSDVQNGDTIKVVDGPLNIRSGPGTTYSVIDTAATGATATVVDGPSSADGYTWIKINGDLLAVGWVAFEFCTVV